MINLFQDKAFVFCLEDIFTASTLAVIKTCFKDFMVRDGIKTINDICVLNPKDLSY